MDQYTVVYILSPWNWFNYLCHQPWRQRPANHPCEWYFLHLSSRLHHLNHNYIGVRGQHRSCPLHMHSSYFLQGHHQSNLCYGGICFAKIQWSILSALDCEWRLNGNPSWNAMRNQIYEKNLHEEQGHQIRQKWWFICLMISYWQTTTGFKWHHWSGDCIKQFTHDFSTPWRV